MISVLSIITGANEKALILLRKNRILFFIVLFIYLLHILGLHHRIILFLAVCSQNATTGVDGSISMIKRFQKKRSHATWNTDSIPTQ